MITDVKTEAKRIRKRKSGYNDQFLIIAHLTDVKTDNIKKFVLHFTSVCGYNHSLFYVSTERFYVRAIIVKMRTFLRSVFSSVKTGTKTGLKNGCITDVYRGKIQFSFVRVRALYTIWYVQVIIVAISIPSPDGLTKNKVNVR